MSGRLRIFALRATVAAVPLLLGLAAAELVARKTYGPGFLSLVDPYEHHPYRPFARYTDVQSGIEIATNSLGWKDTERRTVARRFSGLRIVVLGDSFAEGLGLPAADTVPARLETALRRRGGRSVEVLNGGRVSYSPLVEYQRLRRFFASGYSTDVVVVMPDLSDPQDDLSYAKEYVFAPDGSPDVLRSGAYSPFVRWAYNHFALARQMRRLQLRLRGEAIAPGEIAHGSREIVLTAAEKAALGAAAPLTLDRYEALSANARAVLRTNWIDHEPSRRGWALAGLQKVEENLERIARLAAAHGAVTLVVLYPDPQSLFVDPRLRGRLERRFPRWFHERDAVAGPRPGNSATAWREPLSRWARSRGIAVLDLWPAFLQHSDWPDLFQAGDVHFNAAGCDLVARHVAAALATAPGATAS
jgi:lysophospholipase L1-like esterase